MALRRNIKTVVATTIALCGLSTPALASVSPALPNPATQGTEYTRTFSYGGQSCSFKFYFGNYGGGYANVRIDSGDCNYGSVAVTSVTNGNWGYDEDGTGSVGGGYVQAHTPGKNLLQADFCIELDNSRTLDFSYNALNNTLSSTPLEASNSSCFRP